MAETTSPPSLVPRLAAEVFGTYMLVFGVIGTALFFTPTNGGALPVALAVGIAVLTAAYAVGAISGGHFNPAVTLGAAAAGRAPWSDLLPYWLAQIVGGVLATLTLGLFGLLSDTSLNFGAVSNGFDGDFASLGTVFVAEIIATALFVLIILGVTAPKTGAGAFAPLAIGLALTLFHFILIPISNASLNPARSIATAVLGGPDALAQLWVFLLAPLVGGIVGGLIARPLYGRQ